MRRHTLIVLSIIPLALACRDAALSAPTTALIGLPIPSIPVPRPVLRIDVGTLGGASSFAWDVNNRGTVVGAADNAAGLSRAFRWTADGGMTDLGTLPGHDWSAACCITNTGEVLGVSRSTTSPGSRADVVWSPSGSIRALSIPLLPGAHATELSDFNEQGDVVGSDFSLAGQFGWFWSEAKGKYDITSNTPNKQGLEGSATAVDGEGLVLATGKVMACFRTNPCWRPILWSHETGYRVLGTPNAADSTEVAMAKGLAAGPIVVGLTRSRAHAPDRPYRWIDGEGFTILPTDAGGVAEAVNARGTAVGRAFDAIGAFSSYALAWPRSGGAIRLSPDVPSGETAVAINSANMVVGWSVWSGGATHATVWFLDPVSDLVASLAAKTPVTAARTWIRTAADAAADAAVNACLSDPDAQMSHGALFACVNRSAALTAR